LKSGFYHVKGNLILIKRFNVKYKWQ